VKYTLPILFRTKGEVPAPNAAPSKDSGDQVFSLVEKQPEFAGGMDAMLKFLSSNIMYPAEAAKKNIEGRVVCQFVIAKDGTITNPKVLRSVDPLLDAEAIRVINQMPKWIPGEDKGKAVNVKYTLPILFRNKGEATAPAAK
jgi:TonB family protein